MLIFDGDEQVNIAKALIVKGLQHFIFFFLTKI